HDHRLRFHAGSALVRCADPGSFPAAVAVPEQAIRQASVAALLDDARHQGPFLRREDRAKARWMSRRTKAELERPSARARSCRWANSTVSNNTISDVRFRNSLGLPTCAMRSWAVPLLKN